MDNTQKQGKNARTYQERIRLDFLIHELKSPLAVIEAGIISLLRRTEKYGPLTEKQKKVLQRALRNTRATQTLVSDTLELGRAREGVFNLKNCRLSNLVLKVFIEALELADVNTSERVKKCADLPELTEILKKRGISLIIDENLWCQELCLEEVKIKQILRNLLSNALKYRKSSVVLDLERTGDFLSFSVTDDGKGIPQILHKKIFECYFQADDTDDLIGCDVRGHGLGLAGVMVLLEDMGGELFLESEEGRGAKFLVKVPLPKRSP